MLSWHRILKRYSLSSSFRNRTSTSIGRGFTSIPNAWSINLPRNYFAKLKVINFLEEISSFSSSSWRQVCKTSHTSHRFLNWPPGCWIFNTTAHISSKKYRNYKYCIKHAHAYQKALGIPWNVSPSTCTRNYEYNLHINSEPKVNFNWESFILCGFTENRFPETEAFKGKFSLGLMFGPSGFS